MNVFGACVPVVGACVRVHVNTTSAKCNKLQSAEVCICVTPGTAHQSDVNYASECFPLQESIKLCGLHPQRDGQLFPALVELDNASI